MRHAPYSGSMQTMTGKELRLTRMAMDVDAQELAAKMGYASRSSISHIETRGKVREATAKRYLDALATFGTVPTVTVSEAA